MLFSLVGGARLGPIPGQRHTQHAQRCTQRRTAYAASAARSAASEVRGVVYAAPCRGRHTPRCTMSYAAPGSGAGPAHTQHYTRSPACVRRRRCGTRWCMRARNAGLAHRAPAAHYVYIPAAADGTRLGAPCFSFVICSADVQLAHVSTCGHPALGPGARAVGSTGVGLAAAAAARRPQQRACGRRVLASARPHVECIWDRNNEAPVKQRHCPSLVASQALPLAAQAVPAQDRCVCTLTFTYLRSWVARADWQSHRTVHHAQNRHCHG